MTKKNAAKSVAKARKAKFGGKYMHHRRLASGGPTDPPGPANRKLSMETALALAGEQASAAVARAHARFAGIPYVYVVGDASEPLGAAIAAACRASVERITFQAARKAIEAEVSRRHAQNGNLPFGGLLTVDDLGNILNKTSTPEQIHVVVELMARFSTPAHAGHVHVFAVAAGEVLASLAPVGVTSNDTAASRRQKAYEEAAIGRALHDESEADDDGFIAGAGFDRYGGFPGDGLS